MTLNVPHPPAELGLSQNDLDIMKVKCSKFEVSTFISFEVIDNSSRKCSDIKEI